MSIPGIIKALSAIGWYDRVSRFFDIRRLDPYFYHTARAYAIEQLQLEEGDVVLDLFCGSGTNFAPVREAVGSRGLIVGVDGAGGMLRRAQEAANAAGMEKGLHLVQAALSKPSGFVQLTDWTARLRPTRYLFTLGLACLPNWRSFFRTVFDAAPPALVL